MPKKIEATSLSSELTPKTIVALVQASGISEDEIQHWHADFLHHYPSGQLNKSQFVQYYERVYQTNRLNENFDQIFDLVDVNRDGTIEFNELLAIVVLTSRVTGLNARLSFIFDMWDENGDGYLDHKEFADAIRLTVRKGQRSKKEYSAKKRAKEIIEKFDHDKDKKLSKEEFIQGCQTDPIIRNFLVPNL